MFGTNDGEIRPLGSLADVTFGITKEIAATEAEIERMPSGAVTSS
jgi:hypothetical protein